MDCLAARFEMGPQPVLTGEAVEQVWANNDLHARGLGQHNVEQAEPELDGFDTAVVGNDETHTLYLLTGERR